MRSQRRNLFCGLAMLVLGGCSALDIGSSDYSCPGMPNGVQCKSAREVYELTNNRNAVVTMEPDDQAKADAKAVDAARAMADQQPDARPVDVPAVYANDGEIPIRTQAVVMRVWIAPYEDHNADLHMGGYLYTEVEARKWEVASKGAEVSQEATLNPLQTKPAPLPAATAHPLSKSPPPKPQPGHQAAPKATEKTK